MPEQILLAGELDQAKVAPVSPTRELAFQAAPVMGGGVVVSKIRESWEFLSAQLASRTISLFGHLHVIIRMFFGLFWLLHFNRTHV